MSRGKLIKHWTKIRDNAATRALETEDFIRKNDMGNGRLDVQIRNLSVNLSLRDMTQSKLNKFENGIYQ